MKKKVLSIFIMLLVIISIVSVTAVIRFDTRAEAIAYIRGIVQDRKDAINETRATIKMISDKDCFIDYDSEVEECRACFTFNLSNKEIKDCVILPVDTTPQQDRKIIKTRVKEIIKERFPIETVSYKKANYNGTTFNKD